MDGGFECWGENTYGGLGNGSAIESLVPVPVQGLSGGQGIAAGGYHSCALVNGGVQCWGLNSSGQLGDNSTGNTSLPVAVRGLGADSGVYAIAAGGEQTCALVKCGALCWGWDLTRDGEIVVPVPTPVPGWGP